MEKIREVFKRKGWVNQHSVQSFKDNFDSLGYTYSQIKHGDIKKGEGDIVIINLQEPDMSEEDIEKIAMWEWLEYTRDIKEIKTIGRFTNVYFGDSFFEESLKNILTSE